jgi:hypothetical protein
MTVIGIRLSPDFSRTGLWDFFLRVVLGLYFGWNGFSGSRHADPIGVQRGL